MKKTIFLFLISTLIFSCGPSDAERAKYNAKKTKDSLDKAQRSADSLASYQSQPVEQPTESAHTDTTNNH